MPASVILAPPTIVKPSLFKTVLSVPVPAVTLSIAKSFFRAKSMVVTPFAELFVAVRLLSPPDKPISTVSPALTAVAVPASV